MWETAYRSIYVSGHGAQSRTKSPSGEDDGDRRPGFQLSKKQLALQHKGHRQTASIQFSKPKPARGEYYPWITSGVVDYKAKLMESEESSLLLLGKTRTQCLGGMVAYLRWLV